MKYLLVLLLVPILSASDCGHHKKESAVKEDQQAAKDSIPVCVRALIGKEPTEAPLQIDEYLYKGKKVYLFTPQCCDQFHMLYDDSCKSICAPTGGFTGRGDGKCTDFDSTAKHVKLIWASSSK